MFVFIGKLMWFNGKLHARKTQSSKERLHFFLCLSWWQWRSCRKDFMWFKVKGWRCLSPLGNSWVQWKAARKKNAIFKVKIAFFLVFIMVAMEIM